MAPEPPTHAKGTADTMQSNNNSPSLDAMHKTHCIHQKPCSICGRTHCNYIHCSKRTRINVPGNLPPVEQLNAHISRPSIKPIASKQADAQGGDSTNVTPRNRDHAQSSGSIKLFSKKQSNAQSSGSVNPPSPHCDYAQSSGSFKISGSKQVNAQSIGSANTPLPHRYHAQSSGSINLFGPKQVKAQNSNSTKLAIPEQADVQSSGSVKPSGPEQVGAQSSGSTKLHIPEQPNAQSNNVTNSPASTQAKAPNSESSKTPRHKHSHRAAANEDISSWSHISVGREGAVVVNVSTKDQSKLGHVSVYGNIPRVDEPSVKVRMEDVKGEEGEEDGKGENDGKEGEEGEWEVV